MNVLIAGGGTAGHVFPALAVADELASRGIDVGFIGSSDGQEAALVPGAGYPFQPVRAVSAQTRLSLRSIRALAVAVRAGWSLRPAVGSADVVLGVGGFASAPAVLAARLTHTPLVLHEQNSVPGAVNRLAARWARGIATTFAATATHLPGRARVRRTGNPIRAAIARVADDRERLRRDAWATLGLESGRTTVLVMGGSQGALRIDRALAGALPALAARDDLQLLVSTGPAHLAVVAEAIDPSAPLRVRAAPFIDRMDLALAAADLVVSRAGAGVAEIAACSLPSVLIPYPHATEDHQTANAREVAAAGAAVVIADRACTPEALASCILELVDAPDRRRAMASAARAWARPDAAARVADLVVEVAA